MCSSSQARLLTWWSRCASGEEEEAAFEPCGHGDTLCPDHAQGSQEKPNTIPLLNQTPPALFSAGKSLGDGRGRGQAPQHPTHPWQEPSTLSMRLPRNPKSKAPKHSPVQPPKALDDSGHWQGYTDHRES